jgi:predicted RecB family nuclease
MIDPTRKHRSKHLSIGAYGRWKHDPSMHGYHYAAYETTALKRLMCRYASREAKLTNYCAITCLLISTQLYLRRS